MTITLDALVLDAQSGDPTASTRLVELIKDDIYKLAMRMLAVRADAEDATQDILINVLKGLEKFRADSSFRTWVWRIAVNHILKVRQSVREQVCSFDALDEVLKLGLEQDSYHKQEVTPEVMLLAREVRLSCTHAMLLSLDRDHRLSFILGTVFELDSQQASEILQITSAAYRKRLERARRRLDKWMQQQCGLVNASAGCSCIRQVALATEHGHIDAENLTYSGHPESVLSSDGLCHDYVRKTTIELDQFAATLLDHPDYAAPEAVTVEIRSLIQNRELQAFR